ncbi:MAG: hypothetical protein ACI31G_03260 [Bacilli bacterium]
MDNFDKNLNQSIIDSFSSDSIPDVKDEVLKAYNAKSVKKKNKTNIAIGVLVPSLSFVFAFIVILPFLKDNPFIDSSISTSEDGPIEVTEVNNKNNQIAFSILSAENMIDAYQTVSVPSLGVRNNDLTYSSSLSGYNDYLSEQTFVEEMNNINSYMFTAECMINTTISSSYVITYNENEEYPYLMTIKDTEEESVKFYYKETLKEHEDDEYVLEGYFDINGVKYSVRGEKEVDAEEEDIEMEEPPIPGYGPGDNFHEDDSEYELDIEIDLNNGCLLCIYHEIETSDNFTKEIYKFAYVNKNVDHGRDKLEEFVSIKFSSGKNKNSDVQIERNAIDNSKSVYSLWTSEEESFDYYMAYQIMNNSYRYTGFINLEVIEEDAASYYMYTETLLGYSIKLKRN